MKIHKKLARPLSSGRVCLSPALEVVQSVELLMEKEISAASICSDRPKVPMKKPQMLMKPITAR